MLAQNGNWFQHDCLSIHSDSKAFLAPQLFPITSFPAMHLLPLVPDSLPLWLLVNLVGVRPSFDWQITTCQSKCRLIQGFKPKHILSSKLSLHGGQFTMSPPAGIPEKCRFGLPLRTRHSIRVPINSQWPVGFYFFFHGHFLNSIQKSHIPSHPGSPLMSKEVRLKHSIKDVLTLVYASGPPQMSTSDKEKQQILSFIRKNGIWRIFHCSDEPKIISRYVTLGKKIIAQL